MYTIKLNYQVKGYETIDEEINSKHFDVCQHVFNGLCSTYSQKAFNSRGKLLVQLINEGKIRQSFAVSKNWDWDEEK